MTRFVEALPSGRYRVRERDGRTVRTIALVTTAAEAERIRSGAAGATLASEADGTLDRRELQGKRDNRSERGRYKNHIKDDPIARVLLERMTQRDVVEWRDRLLAKGRAPQTTRNVLGLLRLLLDDCVERGLIDNSPATGVRLPRRREAPRSERWRILSPDEQVALIDAVPWQERPLVAFALFTGARQGEQWNLEFSELDLNRREVTIRYGSRGNSTKSGKRRTVPLIDLSFWAVQEAKKRANDRQRLVFPTTDQGVRRQKGEPKHWKMWVKDAGIVGGMRWHDLRHTCATSLLAGW